MATVTYQHATRYYKDSVKPAVDHLNLDIADGEFLVLVGPSGCGKTTTLRMLAGLEGVDEGTIHIGEKNVTETPPSKRDIAMVFQNYALYPHMTVGENIGFHLKIIKTPQSEIKHRVAEVAKMLDLTPYLDRRPAMLSGGQRQRVAMGRAIVRSPQVFLMDEPLSNLDAKLRVQTRTQIAELQHKLATTTVYVTHDQVEAMTLGHRVAILKEGVLQQVDKPAELYRHPINIFVAGFIGSPAMNLFSCPIVEGNAHIGSAALPLNRQIINSLDADHVVIGIRPENLQIVSTGSPLSFPVTVQVIEELGADSFLYCSGDFETVNAENGTRETQPLAVRAPGLTNIAIGEKIHLSWDGTEVLFFNPTTGERMESA